MQAIDSAPDSRLMPFELERDPELPLDVLALPAEPSAAAYRKRFGDAILNAMEAGWAVLLPRLPIDFDYRFLQQLTLPEQLLKVGTGAGLEDDFFVLGKKGFAVDRGHALLQLCGGRLEMAGYFHQTFVKTNHALSGFFLQLFGAYPSLTAGPITWRFARVERGGMHSDVFGLGAPLAPAERRRHRLRFFVNVDREPRRWRLGPSLAEALLLAGTRLPDRLPDDLNLVSKALCDCGVYDDAPGHAIAIPTGGAVLVNGEVRAHEVIFGQRMLAGDFFCDAEDMVDPAHLAHSRLAEWLGAAGYERTGAGDFQRRVAAR